MSDQTPVTPTATPETPANPANPAAAPSTPADWTSGFSDELKGFVQTKNFPNPQVVVESYRNLEKLTGGGLDKLLKIPEKADAPEWNDIYAKLGRPSKPEEYKIPVAEGDKGEFAKMAANWFHEAGLTQRQAEAVATKWNEFQGTQSKAQLDQMAAKNVAEEAGLKNKWGLAFEQNVSVAQEAAKKFGVTADVIEAMESKLGYAKTMEFFHGIGAGLGEHKFISPDNGSGPRSFGGKLTPEQATARIAQLRADKGWVSKWAAGDAEARSELQRLHQFAFPGDTVL